ncbi:MAG: PAN domain-containing protein [Nostoc sp. NOS(2021)]|uniref:PAN domain-containing protein n=1 Tax=Nostoc sp. NOS(2021) TaxID=2815407 RepID=UPI0025F7E552|nr:PAN domain-containing protein [Nostoc sp. NOS(2021)]MBN3895002.1 PAN domain-containing protein [Nostoc sp. NOS(2021)]
MKLKMVATWQYAKKNFVFPRNIIFFGLALLLILGFSTIVNFTPLAQPAVAQVAPISTTIPRYAVTAEFGRDRPGSDYYSFTISAYASICQEACINDTGCIAYTYVRPGPQGPSAVCYLKSVAPASNPNDCCVSGVKL